MNSFTILFVVLATAAYGMASQDESTKLYKAKMDTYHKEVEPDHVNVTFGLNIQCGRYCAHTKRFFTSVWERYTWTDSRLAWEPSEYGGVKSVKFCPDDIWTPDFRLYTSTSAKMEKGHVRAIVTSHGDVTWIVPALYETFCKTSDTGAHCQYKVGSWAYSDDDMHMDLHPLGVGDSYYDEHCPYVAKVGTVEIKSHKYPCCPETYSSLEFIVDYTKRTD